MGKSLTFHTVQEGDNLPEINPGKHAYVVDVGQDDAKLILVANTEVTEEEVIEALKDQGIPIYYDDGINMSPLANADLDI